MSEAALSVVKTQQRCHPPKDRLFFFGCRDILDEKRPTERHQEDSGAKKVSDHNYKGQL